jgi:hypothetical protein
VQLTIRVEIGLESLRPHLGDDFDGLKLTVLFGPFFGPRPGAGLPGLQGCQRSEQQGGEECEGVFHG